MRVRTRDQSRYAGTYTGKHQGEKPDGSLVTVWQSTGGSHCPYLHKETITDEEIPKGTKINKSITHYVKHQSVKGSVQRRSGTFKSAVSDAYVKTHWSFTGVDITDFNPPVYMPSSSAIAAAHDEALRFFGAGCTKEEVSIPLFVWELGEVRRLITQLANLLKSRSSARTGLPVAEEFGVSPVIRDIKNTVEAVLKVTERLKWMRKNDGKPVKVRFSKELPTGATGNSAIPYYTSIRWHKGFTKSYAMYRAHARIRYNVRYLGDTEIRLRMIAQSLGFLNPVKVVWDHIPFSFLIDKLIDIGGLLERFSMPFVFQHNVEDMGWSIKVEEVYRWYYTFKGESFVVSETAKKFYERKRGLALTFQAPAFTDPSVDALAYGLRFLSLAKSL